MDIYAIFFSSAVQVIPILHWVKRFAGKSNGFYETNIVSLKKSNRAFLRSEAEVFMESDIQI